MIRNNFPLSVSIVFLYIIWFSSSTIHSKILLDPQSSRSIIFTKSGQTLGNETTFGLAIADIDLDGDKDICIANYSTSEATRLWINDGNGNFTLHSQSFGVPYAAHDVDLADLNGDQYPDIFLANHGGPSKVYLSNGNGGYSESSQNVGTAGDHPQTIQLIDIDGDSDNDAYLYNISAPNRVWLNDGTGIFTMRNIDYGGDDSNRQILADLNNDQFPDLYISYRTKESELWLNDGDGNFINTGQNLGQSNDDIDFADVDGDEDIDIVGSNYANMSVWLNQNNTGTFTPGFTFNEGAWRLEFIDVELDGDADLITTHFDNGDKLWLNDGSGNFTFFDFIFEPTSTFSIIGSKDLDGDNDIDIVLAEEVGSNGHSIYFNESTISGIDINFISGLTDYKLFNNYPNPFNPTTTIEYQITELSFVALKVFDVLGNEIATLVNEEKQAGNYEVDFNASKLPSGIYFYRLQAVANLPTGQTGGRQAGSPSSGSGQSFVETKKMVLMK